MMRRVGTIAALLFAPLPVLAHAGGNVRNVTGGFAAGFMHPLSGWDHLLAMVAVALWAGIAGGAARVALPAAFLGGMAVGGLLGAAQFSFLMVEAGVFASVLVLGVLVALAVRPPLVAAAGLLVMFGLLHGLAHRLEMEAGTSGPSYAVGFLTATALLHGIGLGSSARASSGRRGRVLVCLAGGMMACTALALVRLG
ncbi:MAG: HupE/UreJ family protein [Acetobacteraceae bacterium]|nr:HupE/UreJ family protein [Acetobacteraceae bacterium]